MQNQLNGLNRPYFTGKISTQTQSFDTSSPGGSGVRLSYPLSIEGSRKQIVAYKIHTSVVNKWSSTLSGQLNIILPLGNYLVSALLDTSAEKIPLYYFTEISSEGNFSIKANSFSLGSYKSTSFDDIFYVCLL